MKAMYNAGAQLSLGELNKNITKAGKALARVSTGQRIIGAQDDDSASFAISEKMREQIRSLLQDNQNVQNGSSMIKVAERGIDQIVQLLDNMKQLAIDAANDSNTDEDRRTIQKEFDQRAATINDIAIGTEYNGKILLDGRWSRGGVAPLKPGGGGTNTKVTNMVGSFGAGSNATTTNDLKNGASPTVLSPVTQTYVTNPWSFNADVGFKSSSSSNSRYGVELDFSAMQSADPYPDTLNNQGFTILCGGISVVIST